MCMVLESLQHPLEHTDATPNVRRGRSADELISAGSHQPPNLPVSFFQRLMYISDAKRFRPTHPPVCCAQYVRELAALPRSAAGSGQRAPTTVPPCTPHPHTHANSSPSRCTCLTRLARAATISCAAATPGALWLHQHRVVPGRSALRRSVAGQLADALMWRVPRVSTFGQLPHKPHCSERFHSVSVVAVAGSGRDAPQPSSRSPSKKLADARPPQYMRRCHATMRLRCSLSLPPRLAHPVPRPPVSRTHQERGVRRRWMQASACGLPILSLFPPPPEYLPAPP